MPSVQLWLRAENVPSKDLIGASDPYVEIRFDDKLLATSEVIKNEPNPQWQMMTFDLPKTALFRHVNVKIMDKDKFTKDDLVLDCEIRYPFRKANYSFGSNKKNGKACRLMVLNDHGEAAETDKSAKVNDQASKVKQFMIKKLGKMFLWGGGKTAHFWRSKKQYGSKFYFSLKSSICELWPKIFRSAKVRFFAQKFY